MSYKNLSPRVHLQSTDRAPFRDVVAPDILQNQAGTNVRVTSSSNDDLIEIDLVTFQAAVARLEIDNPASAGVGAVSTDPGLTEVKSSHLSSMHTGSTRSSSSRMPLPTTEQLALPPSRDSISSGDDDYPERFALSPIQGFKALGRDSIPILPPGSSTHSRRAQPRPLHSAPTNSVVPHNHFSHRQSYAPKTPITVTSRATHRTDNVSDEDDAEVIAAAVILVAMANSQC